MNIKIKIEPKIKNCPWCGSKSVVLKEEGGSVGDYTVQCSKRYEHDCPTVIFYEHTKKEAIKKWNRRPKNLFEKIKKFFLGKS